MRSRWHRRLAGPVALVCLAGLSGCQFGGHGDSAAAADTCAAKDSAEAATVYSYKIDNTAQGPATPAPGAHTGGAIRIYDASDYPHLDPARIYVNNEQSVAFLLSRELTGYVQHGTDIHLVGDLATDTGRTSDGGKTWTYTLRDGVTWEDGSPITSADVKWGLEREFVPDYSEGPTYFQSWIANTGDFHSVYQGPYDGKSLDAIATPDAKTVVISFKSPQPDLPFDMALQGAPVKQSKDTRQAYDQHPLASGPYKIASREVDKSLLLVRNTAWKADTDPIRTAYPDSWIFNLGETALQTTQRLIGAAGDDAAAITLSDVVPPQLLDEILSRPDLQARSVVSLAPFVNYEAINTKRVTDLRVRQALMYAWPRCQLRQLEGGAAVGEFADALSSPTLLGHVDDDTYHVPPAGDPDKARALLKEAGQLGRQIVMPYNPQSEGSQQAMIIVKEFLKKAGFNVVAKPTDPKALIDETGDPSNAYDTYGSAWAADWPSGATVYPPKWDGRLIVQAPGNTDESFFDDPKIDSEMDQIKTITDPVEAGKRWAQVDREIRAQVPEFPLTYFRSRQIYGPRIGGATFDNVYGEISLNYLYVK
ncbi:MAG TPA: ABC transporter substrate-binding protein [Sporichthyaceae bacterium]|jgi:peptide/nickel transport system substrate-binding protein|nr:ABC transporter substrate-binding protein [Sporichthyaceae bacterium]